MNISTQEVAEKPAIKSEAQQSPPISDHSRVIHSSQKEKKESLIIKTLKWSCFFWGALLALICASFVFFTFLMVEIGFRLLTAIKVIRKNAATTKSPHLNTSIWCYSYPIWEYHSEFGYQYTPNQSTNLFLIHEKIPMNWTLQWKTNDIGNVSQTSSQDYQQAKIKGLVFGDSFSVYPTGDLKNSTWPDLLQEKLASKWNQKVAVHNFARDGYGLLQMVDLAAEKVPELKPDFIIFALIGSDLDRARTWRTPSSDLKNGTDKLYFSHQPQVDTNHPKGLDGILINRKLNQQSAQEIIKAPSHHPLSDEIETRRREIERKSQRHINWLSPRHSFLLNKLFHGDPFISFKPPITIPTITFSDYTKDATFIKKWNRIKETKIPIFAVMLPQHQDLQLGRLNLSLQQQALYTSFESLLEAPIHDLTPLYTGSENEIHDHFLLHINGDPHPSRRGIEFYASAIASKFVN